MNKQKLKKYHFWALAGVAPFLTLLAAVLYMTEVGSEVAAKTKDIETKTKEAQSAKAKGKLVLALLDKQKDELFRKREELWKDNWNRQAVEYRLFDWPRDTDSQQRLKRLAEKSEKFGAPLVNENDAFQVFTRREVYEAAYDKAADAIKPAQFANRNWRGVLRYVNNWGPRIPRGEQIWLALEDLWVQRGLMLPVADVNRMAGTFTPVPPAEGTEPNPLARTFRSPLWELELAVIPDPATGKRVLKSKIKNRTDRIQFLGMRNALRLHVWLSDRPTAQPALYRIEGDIIRAGETKDVPVVARLHEIPAEVEVDKLARVEQLMDERTVPVRQVVNIALGYKDSRTHATELKAPEFFKGDPALAAAAPGAPGAPGAPPGGIPPGSEDGFRGGPGFPGAPGALAGKAGPPAAVLDANSKRYLDATPQVRRMPVAVALVVDQMFMQDALTAYTNSPLRFQITQFHWKRFRGTLPAPVDTADEFAPPAAGFTTGVPGAPGFAGGTPGFSGGTPGFPGGPGFPGFQPEGGFAGFPGMQPAGTLSTVSEGQLTTGLIELTIYGVISLYEKYEEPKKEDAPAAATGETPAAPPAVPPAGTPPTTTPGTVPAPAPTPAPTEAPKTPVEPKTPGAAEPAPVPPPPAPTGAEQPPAAPKPKE